MLYRFHMFTDLPISGFSPLALWFLMARGWKKNNLATPLWCGPFSLQDYVAVEPFFIVNSHRCLPQESLAADRTLPVGSLEQDGQLVSAKRIH